MCVCVCVCIYVHPFSPKLPSHPGRHRVPPLLGQLTVQGTVRANFKPPQESQDQSSKVLTTQAVD